MEWLSALIKEEKISETQTSASLLEDFLYYALQNINSSSLLIRSSALKIIDCLSTINQPSPAIENYFFDHAPQLSQTHEPEHVYLISNVYFTLLVSILNSNAHDNLVKGNANANLVKVYNPDHEKQAEELKGKISLICEKIYDLYSSTPNTTVKTIIGRKSIFLLN